MFEFFRIAVPVVLLLASIASGLAYGIVSRKDGTVRQPKKKQRGRFTYEELKLTKGLVIGLVIGVVVGLLQMAFHLYDWALCMGLGLTFGMTISMWLDKGRE